MNDEFYEEEEIEEYMQQKEELDAKAVSGLPSIIERFYQSASEVSLRNEMPAAISGFVILGNICKDFVRIPNNRNIEDTRVHFCWVQTSGTGKSTLWNFVGPVADRTFEKINEHRPSHPSFTRKDGIEMPRKYDIFGVTDYTDSVLIGKWKQIKNDEGEDEMKRQAGILEGSGLAHWDEFEYSGIFKQSQHKEQSIVYLNTLMNSLAGKSWVISKALDSMEGMTMNCYSERSVIAMTYPPKNLNDVMAEKGVLQRMLLYVWEVPFHTQHQMRLEQLSKAGTYSDVEAPIDKFAEGFYKIYQMVRERWNDVGQDPLKTLVFHESYVPTLLLEYNRLNKELMNCPPHVAEIASNFTTRLMQIMMKLAALCCIGESADIVKPEERFIVRGVHVQAAGKIVQNCYSQLVGWLERSLRVKRKQMAEKSLETTFIGVYGEIKADKFSNIKADEAGFVNKNLYLTQVREKAKISRAQIYRHYDVVRHRFEEIKEGRSWYVRLLESEE
tara:strand:- start:4158 stop:5657 length:1500 start_codon:yes stop_codon:yes gene_type:complete